MTDLQTAYKVLLLIKFYYGIIFDSITLSLRHFTATEILKLIIFSFVLLQKKNFALY